MQSELLIQSLITQSQKIITDVEALRNEELPILTWKADPNSWSILACLEHLNLYGDFYLPKIATAINKTKSLPEPTFTPGILGNYFSKMMLPQQKLRKMKTFANKNPLDTKLDKAVIDRFVNQQIQMIELLGTSRKVSLSKVTIPTSISSMLTLKLGDTFQFIINHNMRHLKQIENIMANIKNTMH